MDRSNITIFALGLLAGGLAIHLYDHYLGSLTAPSLTADSSRQFVASRACADPRELQAVLESLKAQVAHVPPTVTETRGDGSSYSRPNRLYEQIMLQVIQTTTELDASNACRSGTAGMVRKS